MTAKHHMMNFRKIPRTGYHISKHTSREPLYTVGCMHLFRTEVLCSYLTNQFEIVRETFAHQDKRNPSKHCSKLIQLVCRGGLYVSRSLNWLKLKIMPGSFDIMPFAKRT